MTTSKDWEEKFYEQFSIKGGEKLHDAGFSLQEAVKIGGLEYDLLQSLIPSLLTSQKQEIIEMIEGMKIRDDFMHPTLMEEDAYNDALSDIINKIKELL